MKDDNNKKIAEVFVDVEAHRFTADIVRRHSSNRADVREVALDGLNLTQCKDILELGCGFGFFTEALKGRVRADAVITGVDIVPGYESSYLKVCETAGIKGCFTSTGVSVVKDYRDRSFDLVICSYCLYFFPEIVPEIARVLRKGGLLVTTVHNKENMSELMNFAKDVFVRGGIANNEIKLPIESFIRSFSSENGYGILSNWFEDIHKTHYGNTLVFKPGDIYSLIEYFRFKWPFFLTTVTDDVEAVFDLFEMQLQQYFTRDRTDFIITKDDTIFVCSKPFNRRRKK
jgi:ubiquinone/menaquinone biosynthesis C-methylase UbiE